MLDPDKIFTQVLWVTFLIGFCNPIVGQDNNKSNSISTAERFYVKGDSLKYIAKDSSLFYFNRAYTIFEQKENWLFCIYIIQQLNSTSSWHYDIQKLDFYIKKGDTVFNQNKSYFDSIPQGKMVFHHHLVDKINYWEKLRRYDKVKEISLDLRNRISKIPDSIRSLEEKKYLSVALEYEGIAHTFNGEYAKAEEFYNLSLSHTLEEIGPGFAQQTYSLLGDLYIGQGRFKEALHYIKQNLQKELGSGTQSKNRVVTNGYTIANGCVKWFNKEKDSSLLDSATYYLSISKENLKQNDPLSYRYYYLSGRIQWLRKNYEKALIALDSTLFFLKKDSIKSKRVEMARTYSVKADVLQETNAITRSLEYYQKGVKQLSNDFYPTSVFENPLLKEVEYKYEYLKILKRKILALEKASQLKEALSAVEESIKIIDNIKSSFWNEDDKQFLIENFYPIFESGIRITHKLYDKTKDDRFIDTSFYLSEKGKSVVLLEALLNSRAYHFSNLPKRVYENEYALNKKAKKIKNKRQLAKNRSELLALNKELIDIEASYRNFIEEIEVKFPQYYNLKYNNEVISIKEFQKTLNDKDMLLSYFYTENSIYVILVSRNKKECKRIPLQKDFKTQLDALIKNLQDPTYDLLTLNQNSQDIYKMLIASLGSLKNIKKLIIIPDGILNYLPFESLYTGEKYLIEDKKVTYTNSATLLHNLKLNTKNDRRVLAFAPTFSGAYMDLPHSKKEVKEIRSYWDGKSYEGKEATLKAFIQQSSMFNIIHLTTHSILDDKNPDRSKLIFGNHQGIDSLSVQSIYNLNLNASLITLNACETGIGKLSKGEGMLSVSRAFFYAGVSSILSTKWKVNDKSSSDITIGFYKYLSKGKEKDEALRLAKIDFLKRYKDTDYVHPYWWSGLVLHGNTEAIAQEYPLIWYVLGGLLLLIGLFLMVKKIVFNSV